MEEWKKVKIGDVLELKQGLAINSKTKHFVSQKKTSLPLLRITDMQEGNMKVFMNETIPERYISKPTDIIYTRTGKVGLVFTNQRGVVHNNCFRVIPKDSDLIDMKFLYWLLKQKRVYEVANSIAVGSAQPDLSHDSFKGIEIYLPPLATQKKIAEVLSSLDDKIELNNKINANLEQQAQAIFKSWFVDFEPFGGEMPAGWKEVPFSDFLIPRTEKSNNPSIPMYSVTDTGIHPRDEKFNKSLCKSTTKNKIIYKSDIVFGMSREILNWGVFKDEIGGVSSAYNIYSVSKDINYKYLEGYIKYHVHYFKDLIKPASREGQGVDKSALMQKVLLLPPADVLNEYYTIEDSLLQKIKICNEENKKLSTLRDTLLPKLLSGELEV